MKVGGIMTWERMPRKNFQLSACYAPMIILMLTMVPGLEAFIQLHQISPLLADQSWNRQFCLHP
jgi:hypothetical protein